MPDYDRLAGHVTYRRVALGYQRRQDLANTSGISARTLGDIETGRGSNYNRTTLAALEAALHWQPGSISAVLDGADPTETGSPNVLPADEAVRLVLDSDLPDDVKKRLVQILEDDRADADRRRFDLARTLIEAFLDTRR